MEKEGKKLNDKNEVMEKQKKSIRLEKITRLLNASKTMLNETETMRTTHHRHPDN